MQLKFDKSIRNNVIMIALETINFTPDETKALDRFGEPEIHFEKSYAAGQFPVAFTRKIRKGFKVRVKFDGSQNIEAATAAANQFFEEIQEELADAMFEVMAKYEGNELEVKTGFLDIKY